MNLKGIIKELTIKNDINTMEDSLLREKYFSDDSSYKEFLECFGPEFLGMGMYSFLIYHRFDLLEKLFTEKKINGDTNFWSSAVLKIISRDRKFISEHNYYNNVEVLCRFQHKFGVDKLNDYYGFIYLNQKFLEYATFLDKTEADGEVSKDDYMAILDMSDDDIKTRKIMDAYLKEKTRLALCCDPMFLVAANYFVSSNYFGSAEEFIDLVKDVIDISENTNISNYVSKDFDKKEYHRIAKFTLKKMDEMDPRVSKDEKNEKSFMNLRKVFSKKY